MKKALSFILVFVVVFAKAEDFNFSKKKIRIAKKVLEVEIADTHLLRERGLMFRNELKDGTGMLFIFEDEQPLAFWMKNTFVPLSIGYFDKNKRLIDIQEMKAVESEMVEDPPSYPSSGPAQFALEVPKEWFAKNKIKRGTKFEILK